jgi:predicted small secreted protein
VIKKLLFVLAGLSVVLLTACNTIEGMGKDIQKAGESIEGAAKKK